MKARYTAIAALALLGGALLSCQKEDSFYRPDNAVKITVSVGALTKTNAASTDNEAQRQFNQGDQIAVSTNDQEAVLFQCTSTDDQTWTEAVTNKFLLWTQNTLTFSAYYPATTGTSMTAFTVPTDQSSVAKIALADYMTRQQVISRPEGGSDIQMQLERKMARVIVRISGFGSQYFDDQKTVSNVRIYSEASGIADGNPTGSSTEIQPYAQGDGGQGSTYTALVVPGYGDSGARFIQLTDGEGSTLLVKGIPELEAGNSYTFNLVVGKNRIEVASVTVQDWTTGETLSGGQATEGSAATLVTAITLNKTATTITKISGTATETLSVTAVTPDEATDKTYTWSSANTDVATVDAEGKVTAVAEGTAHIRATANDGSEVYGECTVTVLDLSAYYSKMTSCGSSAMDQIMKLRDLGKGRTSYNSSLTAAQAWELAKYRATVDGKTTYVIMSSQNEGYEIHYALSTDAAATEHTSDVDDLVDYFSSTILNMYYIAQ